MQHFQGLRFQNIMAAFIFARCFKIDWQTSKQNTGEKFSSGTYTVTITGIRLQALLRNTQWLHELGRNSSQFVKKKR